MFDKYAEVLKEVKLFNNIEKDDLFHLVSCLKGEIYKYDKGNYILSEGEELYNIGIVMKGRVEINKESLDGNKAIISFLSEADIFGEVFVSSKSKKSKVNVVAIESTEVLYINFNKIINSCSKACGFHVKLISNMVQIIADKNLMLNEKIEYLIVKGMREKIAMFLFSKYRDSKTLSFNLSMNRNEMAEYLNVSRASMCRELSRMKEDGIIDYYKNSFKILDVERLRNNN